MRKTTVIENLLTESKAFPSTARERRNYERCKKAGADKWHNLGIMKHMNRRFDTHDAEYRRALKLRGKILDKALDGSYDKENFDKNHRKTLDKLLKHGDKHLMAGGRLGKIGLGLARRMSEETGEPIFSHFQ